MKAAVLFSIIRIHHEDHFYAAAHTIHISHRFGTICDEFGGKIVKSPRELIVATFDDPAQAVKASIKIFRQISTLPTLRDTIDIGIDYGEFLHFGTDVYGTTVNMASKLCEDLEKPGGCFSITEAVYDNCWPKISPTQVLPRKEIVISDVPAVYYDVPVREMFGFLDIRKRASFLGAQGALLNPMGMRKHQHTGLLSWAEAYVDSCDNNNSGQGLPVLSSKYVQKKTVRLNVKCVLEQLRMLDV